MIKWMQIRSFRCRSLVIHAIAFLTFVIVTFYYTISKEYSLSDFSFICQNLIGLRDESNLQIFYNSTCSLASDKRGPHQKVIAYSLYGNFSQEHIYKKYLDPLVETIRIIPLIYPGWLVRIYHNFTIADVGIHRWGFFKNMFSGESHVDFCNVTEIIKNRNLGDIFAMTWRWLPLLDNLVDALMSRDSDSRIVSREEEAVSEWLASDKIFHLMRDHPAHCLFGPILGGCWGVKINKDRSKIVGAAKKIFNVNHFHEYDYDQILLDKIIWPLAQTNVMAHDSYCCRIFSPTSPFPRPRKGRIFVASRVLINGATEMLGDTDECPQECLPQNTTYSVSKFC